METTSSHGGGEETLDKLFMKTGSINELPGIVTGDAWAAIASDLKNVFLPMYVNKTLQGDFAALCTIYYFGGKKAVVADGASQLALQKAGLGDLVDGVVGFLEQFMVANGQWGYIRKQDWFTKGECAIAIDVNYYPDRSDQKALPRFHKDTGGNNIFVNLLFDNDTQIEATEWFTDIEQPSRERQLWQKGLLPASHLQALLDSRTALLHRRGEKVSGGVTAPRNAYVSWVDDLVWHATPSPARRVEYSAEAALRAYDALDDTLKKDFEYYDGELDVSVLGLEILATIAECPDTDLYKWLLAQDLGPQDIIAVEVEDKKYELTLAVAAWNALYGKSTGGRDRFLGDAKLRGASPWLITGVYSEATSYDERLERSAGITEVPGGLAQRRRANSLDENQGPLQEARRLSEGKPRSFVRTWVRILRAESGELKDVNVDLWK